MKASQVVMNTVWSAIQTVPYNLDGNIKELSVLVRFNKEFERFRRQALYGCLLNQTNWPRCSGRYVEGVEIEDWDNGVKEAVDDDEGIGVEEGGVVDVVEGEVELEEDDELSLKT